MSSRRGRRVASRSRARSLLIGLVIASATAACAGGDDTTATEAATPEGDSMELSSPAFAHEGDIPSRYTCDGRDVSPPLTLTGIPLEASSLVVIMDDPDAPRGTWDHWVAFNAPVAENIPEDVGTLGTDGTNSWGRPGYGGPCPPGGSHRYLFKAYALDADLQLTSGATKAQVTDAMAGHVIAEATLMGRYARSSG